VSLKAMTLRQLCEAQIVQVNGAVRFGCSVLVELATLALMTLDLSWQIYLTHSLLKFKHARLSDFNE
jgi:hypothetical protein